MEPPLADALGRGLRVFVVPHHDVGPARQHLAVVGDAQLDLRQRRPHGADARRPEGVDGQHRRGLGQAVALQHRQPHRVEELRHLAAQGRAAGADETQAPAGAGPDLREHEPVGDRRLDAGQQAGFPARQPGAGRGVAHAGGPREQRLPQSRGLGDGRDHPRPQLLEDARHAGHHRRADLLHVAAHRFEGLGEDERRAVVQVQVDGGAFEGVAQRQERQRGVVFGNADDPVHVDDVGQEVAVREHHALGAPGRARRVDDGGQRVWLDGLRPLLVDAPQALLGRQAPVAALDDLGQRVLFRPRLGSVGGGVRRRRGGGGRRGVEDHDGFHPRGFPARRAHLGRLLLVGGQHHPGPAVGQDVADLAGRQGGIDGHRHRPGGQGREVADDPFRAAVREDRDAVAGPDAERRQPQTQVADLVEELPVRPLADLFARAAPGQHRLGEASGHVERQFRQRPDVGLGHSSSPVRSKGTVTLPGGTRRGARRSSASAESRR